MHKNFKFTAQITKERQDGTLAFCKNNIVNVIIQVKNASFIYHCNQIREIDINKVTTEQRRCLNW